MRVKIVQEFEGYRKGDTLEVSKAKGKLLIKQGVAVITKDIVSTDIKVS